MVKKLSNEIVDMKMNAGKAHQTIDPTNLFLEYLHHLKP
jgi:hypothetical protein